MTRAYILLITLISIFLFCITANGQERYIVEAKTLNVRSGPNVHDIVVHTLHKGDIVQVHHQMTSWSRISHNGQQGWVAHRYLRQLPAQPQTKKATATYTRPWIDFSQPKVLYWTILIGLIIPLMLMFMLWLKTSTHWAFTLYVLTLISVLLANVYYFYTIPGATWFFKDPVWYKVAGNVMLYYMYICFLAGLSVGLLDHIARLGNGTVKVSTTIFGVIITSIIAYLLDKILDLQFALTTYIIGGLLLYQLYQIFKNVRIGYGLLYTLLYTLLFGSIAIVCYYCIVPVVILGLLLISRGGSDTETKEAPRPTADNPAADGTFYVNGRFGPTKLTPQNGGTSYYGDDGAWYRYDWGKRDYVEEGRE